MLPCIRAQQGYIFMIIALFQSEMWAVKMYLPNNPLSETLLEREVTLISHLKLNENSFTNRV